MNYTDGIHAALREITSHKPKTGTNVLRYREMIILRLCELAGANKRDAELWLSKSGSLSRAGEPGRRVRWD